MARKGSPSSLPYGSKRLTVLQDTTLSLLGSLLSVLLVRWLSEPVPGFTRLVLLWLGVSLAGSLAGLLATGSARAVRRYVSTRAVLRLSCAVLVKEAVLTTALLCGWVAFPTPVYAVLAVLADLLLTAGLLLWPRYAFRALRVQEDVRDLASRETVLVWWGGRESVRLADRVDASGCGHVAGFLSTDHALAGRLVGERPVFWCANPAHFRNLEWRLGGIDGVFFPQGMDKDGLFPLAGTDRGPVADSTDIIDTTDTSPDIPDTPDTSGSLDARMSPEQVENPDGMTRAGHAVKRGFDAVLSGVLLVVFAPLMALCALAVRWEDGGPALYAQERVGKNGRPFLIYKFRSMRVDAESGGPELFAGDADTRLTRVGRFLRVHHLDELPQLWNVLRGDMSFIGPRPERLCYIERIMERNPRYRYLYQIRPGVTSYATLYNGYTDTLEKMLTRLDLDLYYLRNRSVGFDLRILGLTFLNIVGGRRF